MKIRKLDSGAIHIELSSSEVVSFSMSLEEVLKAACACKLHTEKKGKSTSYKIYKHNLRACLAFYEELCKVGGQQDINLAYL